MYVGTNSCAGLATQKKFSKLTSGDVLLHSPSIILVNVRLHAEQIKTCMCWQFFMEVSCQQLHMRSEWPIKLSDISVYLNSMKNKFSSTKSTEVYNLRGLRIPGYSSMLHMQQSMGTRK